MTEKSWPCRARVDGWSLAILGCLLATACTAARARNVSEVEATATNGSHNTQPPAEAFTILLNTFKRRDLLLASLAHYSSCARVHAIRVLWAEDSPGPPLDAPEFYPSSIVSYDIQPSESLNLRFSPLPNLQTDAVLSLDDDILVACDDLQRTFKVWQQQPDQLVGWFPRAHSQTKDGYRYHFQVRSVLLHGAYSMVLTKGAFMHKRYLDLYASRQPRQVTVLVDRLRNCEDIAMAFLVANATGAAPVFVHVPVLTDRGQGGAAVPGISSGTARHQAVRSHCLDAFSHAYGRMPLVTRPLSGHERGWWLRASPLFDPLVRWWARARSAQPPAG